MADVIAIVMWQMFLPLQYIATLVLADVIAKWQMEWPHVTICLFCFLGRCYCPVADGIATILFLFVVANVIAQCQLEWPLQGVSASICHLVITSANTRVAIYCSGKKICHITMAITSAIQIIRG